MNAQLEDILIQLERLSPMPDDDTVSDEQLYAYQAIIEQMDQALKQNKDTSAIQPLIDSFGHGEGYGLYQMTVGLLMRFSGEQLFPYLIKAVREGERGSRKWAALMLGYPRDRTPIPDLLKLLNDPEEDVRAHAALALSNIGDPSTRQAGSNS